jgi:hypothetical protein
LRGKGGAKMPLRGHCLYKQNAASSPAPRFSFGARVRAELERSTRPLGEENICDLLVTEAVSQIRIIFKGGKRSGGQ